MERGNGRNLNKCIGMLNKIGYGSGNFGFGIIYQIIASYLVFYTTVILNMPGSLVGAAISVSAIWDGLTDPLMGYLSDITCIKRLGRRHLYILIGCMGTAVSNYGLWCIDSKLPRHIMFLWVIADLLIIKSFTTIFATPYVALGAELSADYNERTSIQGVKTIFFLLGLFFASVAGMFIFFKPTPQYPSGQLNPEAYSTMGMVSSLIFLVFGLVCFFTTKKYIPYLPKRNKQDSEKFDGILKLFASFMSALKNKNFKYVAIGYLFINLASSIVSTLGLHVFTYTFSLDNRDIAFVIGCQFLMSILSQPLWVAVSKKIDKKPSVIAGLIISLSGGAVLALLVIIKDSVAGYFVYILPASILVGFGIGGLFSIPLSMVADTIDIEELNSGKRMEGIYYGCLTLFYKLAQSGAVFLLGVLLDIIKFDSSVSVQPDNTVLILGLVLSFGAVLMFFLALLFYSKYKLNKDSVEIIQKQIANRNEIIKQI